MNLGDQRRVDEYLSAPRHRCARRLDLPC
ncbi:hypothetical protein [Pseudomonas sp. MEJ086]